MPENNALQSLERKWEDLVSVVNKLAISQATQEEKWSSTLKKMEGFCESVTLLLNRQDDKIRNQDQKIDGLNVVKDKLNYDNGRLFSDNKWMKAIFSSGIGLVVASYAGLNYLTSSKYESVTRDVTQLEQRLIEIERTKK